MKINLNFSDTPKNFLILFTKLHVLITGVIAGWGWQVFFTLQQLQWVIHSWSSLIHYQQEFLYCIRHLICLHFPHHVMVLRLQNKNNARKKCQIMWYGNYINRKSETSHVVSLIYTLLFVSLSNPLDQHDSMTSYQTSI